MISPGMRTISRSTRRLRLVLPGMVASNVILWLSTPVFAAGASGSPLVTEKQLVVSGTLWASSVFGTAAFTWFAAAAFNQLRRLNDKQDSKIERLSSKVDQQGEKLDHLAQELRLMREEHRHPAGQDGHL